jgi:ComF family protein
MDELSGHKRAVCYGCNAISPGSKTCPRCARRSKLYAVTVGSYYDGAIKELILRLKFHRSYSAARVAAELILASNPNISSVNLITSVPISPKRYRERGYNQSELIAKALAKRTSLPYRPLLERATSDHQLGRSRSERLQAVQGAFLTRKTLAGESIMIIDDVITTGATLAECAQVLREAGAKRVSAAVVARH